MDGRGHRCVPAGTGRGNVYYWDEDALLKLVDGFHALLTGHEWITLHGPDFQVVAVEHGGRYVHFVEQVVARYADCAWRLCLFGANSNEHWLDQVMPVYLVFPALPL